MALCSSRRRDWASATRSRRRSVCRESREAERGPRAVWRVPGGGGDGGADRQGRVLVFTGGQPCSSCWGPCSPSSSSWGLSASIPWRGETDGGGVAGIWEEGRNPGFLRGMGAGRGGGEPGAGCLGTEQEAGFLVSPPTGPAHPCQLPPVLFSHPSCSLNFSHPREAQTGKSCSRGGGSWWGRTLGFSSPEPQWSPNPGLCSLHPPPPLQLFLSTQELATQEVVSLLRTPLPLHPPGPFPKMEPDVGFGSPLLPSFPQTY